MTYSKRVHCNKCGKRLPESETTLVSNGKSIERRCKECKP